MHVTVESKCEMKYLREVPTSLSLRTGEPSMYF